MTDPTLPPIQDPQGQGGSSRIQTLKDRVRSNIRSQALERPEVSTGNRTDVEVMLDRTTNENMMLMETLKRASLRNPELAAEAQRAQIELGGQITPDVAERNIDRVRAMLRERRWQQQLAGEDLPPVMREYLARQDFADVASDEIAKLSAWERVVKKWQAGRLSVRRGDLAEIVKWHDPNDRSVDPIRQELADIGERLRFTPETRGFIEGAAQTFGQQFDLLPRTLLGAAAGAATGAGIALAAGQMGPQVGTPEEVVSVPLMAMRGAGYGFTATSMWETYKVEAGNAYQDFVEAGYDHDLARDVSTGVGVVNALIEVLPIMKVGGPFADAIKDRITAGAVRGLMKPTAARAGRRWLVGTAEGYASENVAEILQEVSNIVGESIIRGQMDLEGMSWEDIGEQLAAIAKESAYGMLIPSMVGPSFRLLGDRKRAQNAKRDFAYFEQAMTNLDDSKVVERRAPSAREFFHQALTGSGDTLFFDAEDVMAALEKSKMTREELRSKLPEVDKSLERALNTGDSMTMPTMTFRDELAGTPFGDALKPSVRFDEDGMTVDQADKFVELEQSFSEKALEAEAADRAFRESARRVEETVLEQVKAIGKLGDADARAVAKFYRSFVSTMAASLDVTPEQFHQERGLTFQKDDQADTLYDHSGKLKIDTPEFKAFFGESKVVDEKGEPLVVYHGSVEPNLQRFDLSKAVEVEGGLFFSSDRDVAEQYSFERAYGEIVGEEQGSVVEAFLSLQNPKEVPLKPGQVVVDAVQMGREIKAAKAAGHDGLILRNIDDSVEGDGPLADVFVAFEPTQIKSVNNRGTFDPNDPNILRQESAATPEFFSALRREIESLNTKASSVSGWKQALTGLVKKGKIKQEEIEWTGLVDWLNLQEGKVTREQVVEFLQGNGVQVETVTLGGEADAAQQRLEEANRALSLHLTSGEGLSSREANDYGIDVVQENDLSGYEVGDVDTVEQLSQELRNAYAARNEFATAGRSKFGEYTLPGGENYREVLLTLPRMGDGGPRNYVEGVGRITRADPRATQAPAFRSSHFDEPNIVAHLRLNDRTDVDGNRVLFVEEIQSDWAQKGRSEGFKQTTAEQQAQIERRRVAGEDAKDKLLAIAHARGLQPIAGDVAGILRSYHASGITDDPHFVVTDEQLAEASRLDEHYVAFLRATSEADRGIPRAPFVESTKGWLNLALKKVMMLAVDGGYDKVAFINGEQSAERYDLSKQVNSITVLDGERKLNRYVQIDIDNHGVEQLGVNDAGEVVETDANSPVPHGPLADVVGKEMAERLMAADPTEGPVEFDGEDLKVGGEGMRAFYDKIVPQAAQKLVKKLGGHAGQAHIELTMGDNVGSDYSAIDITDKLSATVKKGLPLFSHGDKGLTRKGGFDPDEFVARIAEAGDATTFMHEMAHYFLENYLELARQADVPQQLRDDMAALFRWFGVDSFEGWDRLSNEEKARHHEAFAYSFEVYLEHNETPSEELRPLYRRFRDWVVAAYGSVLREVNAIYRSRFKRDLPFLTQEVKDVMGRMVAASEQVAAARRAADLVGLFQTQEESGMSDAEWANYQAQLTEAEQVAIEKMTVEQMKALAWVQAARARFVKAMQKDHKEERRRVRAEVEQQLKHRPVYRALAFFMRGEHVHEDGTVTKHAMAKLNAAAVRELFPHGLPGGRRMPTGRYGLVQKEGGMDPDSAAQLFGFKTGKQMIEAMLEAPKFKDAVEQETTERLVLTHLPDPYSAAGNDLIHRIIHNEAAARFVAIELRALARMRQPVRIMQRAARQAAEKAVGKMTIGELQPYRHDQAAARAARDAQLALAAGDRLKAIAAKRRQLLQTEMSRIARQARASREKAEKLFRKMFESDAKLAKTRDIDLVNAARAILAHFGYGPATGKPASSYLDQVRLYNPDAFDSMKSLLELAPLSEEDIANLTVEQFGVLRHVVDTLWAQSKAMRELEIEGEKMRVDEGVADLITRADEQRKRKPKRGAKGSRTRMERIWDGLYDLKAQLRKVENWAYSYDGDNFGPFQRLLFTPVRHALDLYRRASERFVQRYVDMVATLKLKKGRILAPEFASEDAPDGFVFGRGERNGMAEVIGAMLHMGNGTGKGSNLRKLLVGRGWGRINEVTGDLDASAWWTFVQRLVKEGALERRHFDFLQSVWDLNEETKALAQEAHRRIFGYYFKEVQAEEFTITFPDGESVTYRGGYVPAKVDPNVVRDSQIHSKMEELEADWRAAMPDTGHGFTIDRNDNYARELSLDLRYQAKHLDDVIRFAYVQPAIRDTMKLLRRDELVSALNNRDPFVVDKMLIPWLNRAARQIVIEPGRVKWWDDFWRGARARVGRNIMFNNWRNALQQLTGWFPAALKVPPHRLLGGLAYAIFNPKRTRELFARVSPFMQDRIANQAFDLHGRLRDMVARPGLFKRSRDWFAKHSYFAQVFMQNWVDISTWLGAYNHHLSKLGNGMDVEVAERNAARLADSAVRLTQGSFQPEDVATFEVGGAFYRTLTQFQTYFNMLANLNIDEFRAAARATGMPTKLGRFFLVHLLGFMAPMFVATLITEVAGGKLEDDEDDGYGDELLELLGRSYKEGALAMIPAAGPSINAAVNAFNDKPWDDRMLSSPTIAALEAAARTTSLVTYEMWLEEFDGMSAKDKRDFWGTMGLLTGYPLGQVGKTTAYLEDLESGNVPEPESTVEKLRGLLTGSAARR